MGGLLPLLEPVLYLQLNHGQPLGAEILEVNRQVHIPYITTTGELQPPHLDSSAQRLTRSKATQSRGQAHGPGWAETQT